MKTVLTDASSAILLYKSDLFDILLDSWQVVMAPAVYGEITVPGYPGAALFKDRFDTGRFRVTPPPAHSMNLSVKASVTENSPFARPGQPMNGTGEQETIALFTPDLDGFILMDDARGARECRRQNIPYVNALLVPKLLWYSGAITREQCTEIMAGLCALGRYSNQVRAWALHCTQLDLGPFLNSSIKEHQNHDTTC
ncbi:MAG: hypothetical protein V1793_17515 [Pseudomonadota bacterium]